MVQVPAFGVTFSVEYWYDVPPRVPPVVLVRVKLPVSEIVAAPATAVSTYVVR
jgi:hypothetical protein